MSPRIAIGSTNPAKTTPVRELCESAFPGSTVVPVDVPSGVRAQPLGTEETQAGAVHRARAALAAVPGAWLGLGLEGGVDPDGSLINCVAVVADTGRSNVTWGVRFQLPPAIVSRVLRGEELGPVMDEVSGRNDSKKHQGAVGILTHGLFTRTEMWRGPVACALMPWLQPALYPSGQGG